MFLIRIARRSSREVPLSGDSPCTTEDERESCLGRLDGHQIRRLACPPRIITTYQLFIFVVPDGLPHTIGGGVFMIEIMEPTDFVVRLEFQRGGETFSEGARFMGRDLDFALAMMNFDTYSIPQIRH